MIRWSIKEKNRTTLFFLPSKLHTQRFWFLGDTQGARFYDKHGTTLHLFVILFPVQYMEKRFALETRGSALAVFGGSCYRAKIRWVV